MEARKMKITEKEIAGSNREQDVEICRQGFSAPVYATHPRSGFLLPKHLRHRGIGYLWAVVFLLLILLLTGLSLDTAKVYLVTHQLHNAADAGALAGAPWIKKDQQKARELAQLVASQNFADHDNVLLDLNLDNDPAGDIIVGRYTYDPALGISTFTPYDPMAIDPMPINALAVITSRDLDDRAGHQSSQKVALNYGPISEVHAVNIAGDWFGKAGPYAIATTGGGVGSGLICLRRDLCGLHVQGTSSLTVNNITDPPTYEEGAIQINSSDDDLCLYSNGGPTIIADIINITADECSLIGNYEFPEEPEMYVNYRQPPMPDPLAWLNEPENKPTTNPDLSSMMGNDLTDLYGDVFINSDVKISNYPVPLPFGYYSSGLELDAGTEEKPIWLSSGIYILGGDGKQKGGLRVGANAVVRCEPGVFFYITEGGKCDIQGGADFRATPFKDEVFMGGLYDGIIIAQDPLDLLSASVYGGPGFDLEGTMYFPQHVELQDKSQEKDFALAIGGNGVAFNNQIIADSIYIPGNSDVTINYDGRNPAAVSRAYLVE